MALTLTNIYLIVVSAHMYNTCVLRNLQIITQIIGRKWIAKRQACVHVNLTTDSEHNFFPFFLLIMHKYCISLMVKGRIGRPKRKARERTFCIRERRDGND